jgi:general stress protein YciG
MSGTKIGGQRAAQTNKEIYGEDFYREIGAKGGRAHNRGGFTDRNLARKAGRLGGLKSRRKAVDK